MKTISTLFLAVFSLWAVKVVRHDLAFRKIPNADILTGLKLLAAALAILAVHSWFGYQGQRTEYLAGGFYPRLALHFLWSALIGIALWYAEYWPAGDAKFFIVVSAALPLIEPRIGGFPNGLALDLVINIFVMAAFWVTGAFLISVSARRGGFFSEAWEEAKTGLMRSAAGADRYAPAAYMLNITLIFLLQQVFFMELTGLAGGGFRATGLVFVLMFVLWNRLSGLLFSRRCMYAAAVCCAAYFPLGYAYFPERLWNILTAALGHALCFSLLLLAGRAALTFLMNKKDMLLVPAEGLRPGLVLSEKSLQELKGIPDLKDVFSDTYKDGLTEEQTASLKAWLERSGTAGSAVETVQGRPFSVWIAAGAVLSLVLGRNLAGLIG